MPTAARPRAPTCARASTRSPCIYAKASSDPADARLRELLGGDLRDDARHAEALGLLRAHPALDRAREQTRAVGAQALAALTPLPDSDAKAALVALVDSVVDRVG